MKFREATIVYADQTLVRSIIASFKGRTSLRELNSNELADLDRWLVAGLDRGLLAEVRAWTKTLELYSEGRAHDGWPTVQWVDKILRQQRGNEGLSSLAMRILDPNFLNPTTGIFSLALVRIRLEELRAKFRT